MPESYAPKHRSAPPKRVRTSAKSGAKNAVLFSGAALFATAVSVSAGVAAEGRSPGVTRSPDGALVNLTASKPRLTAADLRARERSASRSSDRSTAASALKAAELEPTKGVAVTRSEDLSKADPRAITKRLLAAYGMSEADFNCIDQLWIGESGWNVHADNPTSSAYGIPQALPGEKMASAGPDWQDNPETQIKWGLGYIAQRYGSGCAAWSFKQGHGWY